MTAPALVFQNANNLNIYESFMYYLSNTPQMKGVELVFGSEELFQSGTLPRVVVYPTSGKFNKGNGYVKAQNIQARAIYGTTEYLTFNLSAQSDDPNPTYVKHYDAVMHLQARVISALYDAKVELFSFEPLDMDWLNADNAQSEMGKSKLLLVAVNIPLLYEQIQLAKVKHVPVSITTIED